MKCILGTPVLATALGLFALVSIEQVTAQPFPIATNSGLIEFSGGAVSDGTNYIVGVISGTSLVAQKVSPTGQLLGTPTGIGSNPGFPPAAAVANGKTQSLVAWSDNSVATGVTMFGQFCSGSGLVGARFPLLASAGSHSFQEVQAAASDGTNYLVLWRDRNSESFYGQLVTGAGTLFGSEISLFQGGGERNVAAVFGKSNYLVAWQTGEENHAYAMMISRGGGKTGPVQISTTPSLDQNPMAAAFDGTNYLVVWNRDTEYSSGGWPLWKLCGRLVSEAGTALGDEMVLVDEQASFPALAFDGDNYLLAWGYNTAIPNTNQTIRTRFLDRMGNAIGPIVTPFAPQGGQPPLLPMNGVFSDGKQTLLTATFGSFVMDGNGDVIGFNGGDVYGTFIPRSTTAPAFTNISMVDGLFQGHLRLVPGVTYTFELSTNLTTWIPAGLASSDSTNLLPFIDEEGVSASSRMFCRVVMGNTLGTPAELFFLQFANGGSFGTELTPAMSLPVSLNGYSAKFDIENDSEFPSPADVFFTGPAGSGLSNTAADANNFNISDTKGSYQSPMIFNPSAAPGGAWTVNYKGTNINFSVADPQAASRLVIPLPTVSISGNVLQSITWVYKNPTTGATLPDAPAYLESLQVQIEGIVGDRLYNSAKLMPSATTHALASFVSWSNVRQIHMVCNDSLANHYVITFSKP